MSEFNMRKIGQQIAAKRKEKNLTQSNLADQLLVSYQQWRTFRLRHGGRLCIFPVTHSDH